MGTLFQSIRALLPDMTIRETDVYVEGNSIRAVGEAPAGFQAETVVSGGDKLLLPGLINAHTHAYMTMFRGVADDLPFAEWLNGHIDPLEAQMTAEDCYWASLLADMEMVRYGTTCALDMFIFPDTAARAALDLGFRTVLSRGLTGGADDPKGGQRRLREARDEIEARRGKHSLLTYMLAPHAPYTCDEGYLREVSALATALELGLHVHISESRFEQETIRARYGCTPSRYLDRAGILTPKTVAAHCVYVDDGDIRLLAEKGVSVVTNPVSNLKLGNGVAPVPDMLAAGVNVALGTDGAASNNALNLFRELGFVTLLHKGLTGDTTVVPAAAGLTMATQSGAKALGLGGVTGVIASGCRADLTVLDVGCLPLRPHNDLLSSLAYCATGSEVETVMIDGRFIMKDRTYLTVDQERVLFEVDKTCRRLGILKD